MATIDGSGATGVPDIFALSDFELDMFSANASSLYLPAGSFLFRQGDTGDSMYLIRSGEVELLFGDDSIRKRLGRNGVFGELGLLIGGHQRTASALAVSDCELCEVHHSVFAELLNTHPEMVAAFLHRAIVRVVRSEQSLMHNLRRRNADLQAALDSLRHTTDQLTHTRVLTRTDDLTGLNNRRGFVDGLHERRVRGKLDNAALLIIDCDEFKQVNDCHGHAVGDRVLQSVAHILRSISSAGDLAARLGGDEFCMQIHLQNEDDLPRIAEYLVTTADALWEMQGDPPVICRLSIGGCRIDPVQEWQHWYECADAALYRAKARGGNAYEISAALAADTGENAHMGDAISGSGVVT
ncbi:MAG: GGDEF domain-containing protein [Pseudomonadota bacterium]|nr:GGDEF domain-containing protein [Pseudomonadota bacterium]